MGLNPGICWYTREVSGPSAEPVGVSDMKRQLSIPTTYIDDDYWLASSISAARVLCEKQTGRAYVHKTIDMVLDRFPYGVDRLYLPFPPLSASTNITSITYYDANNSSTTLATSDYIVNQATEGPSYLVPQIDRTWKAARYRDDAVTIRFVAGYGSTGTAVPAQVRHAIKMLAAHWCENREAVLTGTISKEIEFSVSALLGSNNWGHYA